MASDGGECITAEAQVNYHVRWNRAELNEWGLVTYHDGDVCKYQMDAFGRVYPCGVAPTQPFGDWTAKQLFSRWIEVCPPARSAPCPPTPSPSPSGSPTPEPTPQPRPTPASCPPVVCIAVQVHQHQGPDHQTWHQPWGLVGGWTNLDTTPDFARCLPVWACNDEHHGPCTIEGHPAHQTHTCEPNCSPENPCLAFRRCEDLRGHAIQWMQDGGPQVPIAAEGEAGYQLRIGPFSSPGHYRFRACAAADWRDAEGMPVQVSAGACGSVEFEVR